MPDAPPPAPDPQSSAVTLHVCLTCKGAEPLPEGAARPGAELFAALKDAPGLRVVGVECLSNCKRACTVALSGPGRWTYVYGDLTAAHVPDIVAGAAGYAAAPDGLAPWRERPEIFRKGVIARIPPMEPAR